MMRQHSTPFQLFGTALLSMMIVSLGACAARYGDGAVDRVGSGTAPLMVALKQVVAVPAGRSRVFLQRGRVISHRELDRYRPHCNLEIEALAGDGEVIRPGRFKVVRLQTLREEVVMGTPDLYASLQITGMDDDAGQTTIIRGVHFWLESVDQPAVRRLTCHGAEADPQWAELPTYAEIAEALGDVAELVR